MVKQIMTPPTKSLDETAGKQPWSEEGLVLLDNVIRETKRWTTPVNEGYTRCQKPHCAYCLWVERMKQGEIPTHTITIQSKANEMFKGNWSTHEVSILSLHHSETMKELVELFPNKNYRQIKEKRYTFRKRLGLPPLERWRNHYNLAV